MVYGFIYAYLFSARARGKDEYSFILLLCCQIFSRNMLLLSTLIESTKTLYCNHLVTVIH
jgi:hypothetical protein